MPCSKASMYALMTASGFFVKICSVIRLYRLWKLEMVRVQRNWKRMEYPALSNPKRNPKMVRRTQLKTKISVQISLPDLFATYREMKSVPPEEAPPRSAMTMPKP